MTRDEAIEKVATILRDDWNAEMDGDAEFEAFENLAARIVDALPVAITVPLEQFGEYVRNAGAQ